MEGFVGAVVVQGSRLMIEGFGCRASARVGGAAGLRAWFKGVPESSPP